MQTVYEKPEIKRLLLEACDVITTSGLDTNDIYDTTSGSGDIANDWGGLWG